MQNYHAVHIVGDHRKQLKKAGYKYIYNVYISGHENETVSRHPETIALLPVSIGSASNAVDFCNGTDFNGSVATYLDVQNLT